MVVPLNAESLEYTAWVNAFISSKICAVKEFDGVRSSSRSIDDIYCFASTRFSVSIAPSMKYKDALQALFGDT